MAVRVWLVTLFFAMVLTDCPNNCSGHGSCSEANECECASGYHGDDCSLYLCSEDTNGCSGHGQCRDNVCVCHDGFGGVNCDTVTTNCLNHCSAHGLCLGGSCTCDPGYTGADCSTVDMSVACPQNCSGHGFCDTALSAPTCVCMPSWFGDKCDVLEDKCPESLSNCTGHGICGPSVSSDPSSPWVCDCEPGYCGEACNRVCPRCSNNCTGHGICVGDVCVCDEGFSGQDCSLVGPVASCPNNCSGHGQCLLTDTGHRCVCSVGYAGLACSLVSGGCPGNCSGKGECVAGRCRCLSGFNGTACERAVGTCAASNYCSLNGRCVDGACQCYPGFKGYDCSNACITGGIGAIGCYASLGHGVCVNGTCVCREGEWEGEACETRSHESTMGSLLSGNNPLGVIVLSVVGAAACAVMIGAVINMVKGKRGFHAFPGVDNLKVALKGDDFETAPVNRFSSNY